ncbi:hypothetical protein [Amycolatopsis sp. NPDC004169]
MSRPDSDQNGSPEIRVRARGPQWMKCPAPLAADCTGQLSGPVAGPEP